MATMLEAYLEESFSAHWQGSIDALARDAMGREVQLAVAERPEGIVGFVCWQRVYDLHHCAVGGELTDLYVRPAARGWGVAGRRSRATGSSSSCVR